jgi:MFS family permease
MIVRLSRASSSWVWLLTLFTVAGFAETVFFGQLNAFTPLYLTKLGIPPNAVREWTGAIIAISSAVGLPFLPFWGALADRYARQPIIVRSFVAHLLAGIIMALASNIWVFMLGRSVTSLALGNSGLMMTTLSERTPARRVGLAFSIMNSAPPIGAFVGPLIGGPIVDHAGFRALILIDVLMLLAVALALSIGYRDDFKGANRGSLLAMAADSVRVIARSPRLRALFPALFLVFAGWMLAYAYVPLAIGALYRGDTPGTTVGIVLGVGGLIALVLGPLVGTLADRFGHWRVLFIAVALEIVLWPLPALAQGLVGFSLLWAALNGVATAAFALSFTVLSNSAASDVRGRVMSFAYLPVTVGFMVGPALGSIVTRGGLFAVFPVAAIITALGMGALAVAARQRTTATVQVA